ncbi:MAG: tetratricopeptide repeat protein [Anaerolineae bacterium]|nr:tetratricopeptide repeat protein [Anaerolineae bacterium]
MTTIVELFVRQTQPILLLLDDLQFAHADLDLFNLLTKAISVLPILLVGTYRQEETPQWADQFSTARAIKLGRLSSDEIEQLSTAILGEVGSRKMLQTLLYRETEGNTFFLIEVLRMLAEDAGQLAQIGSRALPEHVFPVGVANVINRRLNRLSDLDQQVLKFAAVCGRIIDFRLIAHCYPDHQLIYWVTHCADAGILTINDGRPEFAHDKLRSVIINSIEPSVLKYFHLQIAEAIEQLYENKASYASMLTHHFYEAGELERAIPYQLVEAERLIELGEMNRARAILMKFLIEVEHRELPQPDDRMMRWYFLLGKTLEYGIMMVGNSEEAIGWYERSLMLSMALNDQSMIATTLTRIAYITLQHYGGTGIVEDMLSKAETIFQETSDNLGLASIAITRAAARALETKYAEAAALYQQAMPTFEQTNNLSLLALARERNGVAIGQMGDLDGSRQELECALQLARQIGDRIRVVNILNALSVNAIIAGDIATAVQHMDEAYSLAIATEQYRTMASIWINRAELYYFNQQYEQARDALMQSIKISDNIGNLRGVAWAYANLAENELFLNNFDGARVALKRWLDIAENMERSALRVGTIPTIRLAVLEHHYLLAAEWLGMMHVICTTERDLMAPLLALQETVKAKLGDQTFTQRFERGKTLIIEQEMPRLRTYIEERYPTSHA